jgi:hypothetical protein
MSAIWISTQATRLDQSSRLWSLAHSDHGDL